MTNKVQSTAFRSSAAPVETYVQQPQVLPKTNTEELADIIKTVNPAIQKYLGYQIKKDAEAAGSKAINDALDDSQNNFAETTKFLKSNKMLGGNIFYDRVYRRTKAKILGGTLESKLKSSYRSTTIDGKPLSNFSLDSAEYRGWFDTTKGEIVDLLGDIDEDTFSNKFMPYLVNATNNINEFHLKEHKAFQLNRLNTEAVGLAHSLIELNTFNPNADDFSKQKFNLFLESITEFENDINKLGLSSSDRSKLNKTILKSAADKAREIGYQTGDSDIAVKIFDSIELFPYGSDGKMNLTNHPDYIATKLELLEKVETYSATKDRRDEERNKRQKAKNLSDGLNNAVTLMKAGKMEDAYKAIEELKFAHPMLATRIDNNIAALDGDTKKNYGILYADISSGDKYETLADARTAAISWFLDEKTPKSETNINRLEKLMSLAGSVDRGILEGLNSVFATYDSHSKIILQSDENFRRYALISKEKMLDVQKLNLMKFKDEMREWKLGVGVVGQKEIQDKYKELKDKYDKLLIEDLNELVNPSNRQDDNNKQIIENNEGFEGVPSRKNDVEGGAFTEGGFTTVEVSSGDTLSGIANDLDTSVEAIKKANGLTSDTIQIGETLVIPEGITDLNKVKAPEFDINKLITEKDHPFKPVREKHNFQVIYNLAKKVGIKFPEVVAAQFGVESVYGSKITGTNNYLGIKAKPEDIKSGNFTEVDTLEEVDGKKIKVKAKFKNFKSIEEMLLDYKKHHNDDFFNGFSTRKGTVNVDTAKEAIVRLKENGYATDSDYVKLVTDVLNDAIRNKFF